jgi:hypothetical protein
MRVANFSEDDHGSIEIVPAENAAWCVDQQSAIDQFSEAHRSGIGWSDVYVRAPVPVPLASRRIRVVDLHAAVGRQLTPFDQVTYEHRSICEPLQTSAYGPDPQVVVFVDHDSEFVRELWATLQPNDSSHIDSVLGGLEKLAEWDLILVDWGWSRVIRLDDEPQLRKYLSKRLDAFTAGRRLTTAPSNWFERVWRRFRRRA